ncbi:MFS transporter [Variovorax dokdonensis]|uniref:MFS transporter n=1 Tax=Variovorax dokdonensis TaxID=344883 RepID=A0ABT7NBU3_9BURK|nr:MFS transporter [Variovorax dokdonensis]MDM0045399.1 MFS transporter [Variovorax dokdonensis]
MDKQDPGVMPPGRIDRLDGATAVPAVRGAALVVVAAGVSAALHLGKLPPAVPALRDALGIDLVEAGFLLSLVQVAGMTLGLLAGLLADAVGLRRSMLIGLATLTLASALGGMVTPGPHALTWLLLLRAVEGIGFLMVVMPGPGLVRALVPKGADKAAMGLWGAYMPLGVALALLGGPTIIQAWGWHSWWLVMSAISLVALFLVWAVIPPDALRRSKPEANSPTLGSGIPARLQLTLRASAPRTLGLAFAVYSAQWMAVIGFLPTVYESAGVAASWAGLMTSLAAAANIVGNVSGGRLLHHGVAPERLLRWGFGAMLLGSVAAFAQWGHGEAAVGLPPMVRYAAVCVFSLAGGMVPATLFMLSVRLAPSPATVSTTVGLMQQTSSLGQFLAPPFVAWLASRVGGWHWTWAATAALSVLGMLVAGQLALQQRRQEEAAR